MPVLTRARVRTAPRQRTHPPRLPPQLGTPTCCAESATPRASGFSRSPASRLALSPSSSPSRSRALLVATSGTLSTTPLHARHTAGASPGSAGSRRRGGGSAGLSTPPVTQRRASHQRWLDAAARVPCGDEGRHTLCARPRASKHNKSTRFGCFLQPACERAGGALPCLHYAAGCIVPILKEKRSPCGACSVWYGIYLSIYIYLRETGSGAPPTLIKKGRKLPPAPAWL